jgi:uncharacterized paraquat-inducible protein A
MGLGRRVARLAALALALALVQAGAARGAGAGEFGRLNEVLSAARLAGAARSAGAASLSDVLVLPDGTRVSDVVSNGSFSLKGLVCVELQVLSGPLELSSTDSGAALPVGTTLRAPNVGLRCDASLSWSSLTVSAALAVDLPSSGQTAAAVGGAAGGAAPLSLSLSWTRGPGRRAQDPQRPVAVQGTACSVALPAARVSLAQGPASGTDASALLSAVAARLVGDALCAEAGKLAAELSAQLGSFNAEVDALVVETAGGVAAGEAALVAALSPQQLAAAVDFGASGNAKVALRLLTQVLNSSSTSAGNNTGGPRPEVNLLVDRLLGRDGGAVGVNVSGSALAGLSTGLVRLASPVLGLSGLDSFLSLDALAPLDGLRFSLGGGFALRTVGVSVRASAQLANTGAALLGGALTFVRNASLAFDVAVELQFVHGRLSQAVAADPSQVRGLGLGQLLQAPLTCGAPALYGVQLSALELQPLNASYAASVRVGGFEDAGLAALAAPANLFLERAWAASVAAYAPNVTRSALPLLTRLVNDFVAKAKPADCAAYAPAGAAQGREVNLTGAEAQSVVGALRAAAADVNDPELGLNALMRALSGFRGEPEGELTLLSEPTDVALSSSAATALTLRLANVTLRNTDSFSRATPFEPNATTGLVRTALGVGAQRALQIAGSFNLSGTGDFAKVPVKAGQFTLDLDNVALEASYELHLLEPRLLGLRLEQLLNASCLASALDFDGPRGGLALAKLNATVGGIRFDCTLCELTKSQQDAIAKQIQTAVGLLPALVGYTQQPKARTTVNSALRRFAAGCSGGIPPTPPPDLFVAAGVNSLIAVNAAGWTLALAAAVGLVACSCLRHQRRSAQAGRTDPIDLDLTLATNFEQQQQQQQQQQQEEQQEQQQEQEQHKNQQQPACGLAGEPSHSLLTDPSGSVACKLLLPALLLVSLVLFVTANMSLGANVEVLVHVGPEQQFVVKDLFNLTLTGTINDMFNAGIPALGVVIALMSGCWPYIRLALLALAFVLPPRALSPRARGTLLGALDAIGKWAVVDQFLIVILVAVFDFEIVSGAGGGLAAGYLALDVNLVPEWGIYGFFLGAATSICANHVASHLHRGAISPTALGSPANRQEAKLQRGREKLSQHVFSPPYEHPDYRLQMKLGSLTFVLGACCAAAVLLIAVGSVLPVVSFSYEGAGGLALGLADPERQTVHVSLFKMLQALANQRETMLRAVGASLISLFFVLSCIVIPLLMQALLIVELVYPLSLAQQRAICFLLDGLAAWSALEVFAVAAITSTLFIGDFVGIATGRLCGPINEQLRFWGLGFGLLEPAAATCLTMTGSVEVAVLALLLGALLGLFNYVTVNSIARLAIEERERELAALKGLPVRGVQINDKNLGCWSHLVKHHLGFLNSAGLVKTRKLLFTTPTLPSPRGSKLDAAHLGSARD